MSSKAQASSSRALGEVGKENIIIRSSLEKCTVNISLVKRSTLTECVLSNVKNAVKTRAKNSQLLDVTVVERCDISDSIIQGGSAVHRSSLKRSVVQDKSSLGKSALIETTVSRSRIRKSSLEDCDVDNSVILGSNFKGMILMFGIWRNGKLTGKTGSHEPIQGVKNAASSSQPDSAVPELGSAEMKSLPIRNVGALDSNAQSRPIGDLHYGDDDSDAPMDIDDSDDDLPLPYEIAIRGGRETSDEQEGKD